MIELEKPTEKLKKDLFNSLLRIHKFCGYPHYLKPEVDLKLNLNLMVLKILEFFHNEAEFKEKTPNLDTESEYKLYLFLTNKKDLIKSFNEDADSVIKSLKNSEVTILTVFKAKSVISEMGLVKLILTIFL